MNTIMEAFASTCEETARWREEKADQFDDDRNRRTAEALRSAAVWARTAEDAEDRLSVLFPDKIQLAEVFFDDVELSTDPLLFNERASQVLSTYCFHAPESLDDWLKRLSDAHHADKDDEASDGLLPDDQRLRRAG